MSQKMTRLPNQIPTNKIMLFNNSVKQNMVKTDDTSHQNAGVKILGHFNGEPKNLKLKNTPDTNGRELIARTETVCSNNSSCTNQKT